MDRSNEKVTVCRTRNLTESERLEDYKTRFTSETANNIEKYERKE